LSHSSNSDEFNGSPRRARFPMKALPEVQGNYQIEIC